MSNTSFLGLHLLLSIHPFELSQASSMTLMSTIFSVANNEVHAAAALTEARPNPPTDTETEDR